MKRLLVSISLIIVTVTTFAQDDSNVHFGLKAAPALAWLRTDSKTLESDGSKFGFSYGLITEFNFAERYAFATGIDVSYRGGKFKSVTTTGPTDSTTTTSLSSSFTLQYIELPLTLKLKTKEIGYLTYYLQAGVAPGFNIRARTDYSSSSQTTVNGVTSSSSASDEDLDIQDDINNFNLSMIIGGGVEYTISGSTVLLGGIQFSNGFLDVFDTGEKVNSNYLALTIAVLF